MTEVLLTDTQFEDLVRRLFSFVDMVCGKHLSPVALLLAILSSPKLQKLITQKFEMSMYDFVRNLAVVYPILHKSRRLCNSITANNLQLDSNSG